MEFENADSRGLRPFPFSGIVETGSGESCRDSRPANAPRKGLGNVTNSPRRSRFPSSGGTRLGISCFLLFAIYGVASPYLQILIRGLGYGPASVGIFLGFFEIAGIFGPFGLARMADRTGGYKLPLIASHLLLLVSLVPLVLFRNPLGTALGVAAFAVGFKALIPLIDGAIFSFAESSGKTNYGKIRVTGSIGFVCIALGLQAIPNFSSSGPGSIAAAIGSTAIVSCFAVVLLIGAASPKPEGGRKKPPSTGGQRIDPGFFIGLVVIAFGRFAMSAIASFLSLYSVEELHWDAAGLLWAIATLSEVPLMILSGRFIAKLGTMGTIALSTAAIAVRLGICAAFPSPAGLIVAQLLHSLVYGVFQPAGVAFVAAKVPPERRALGMAALLGFGTSLPSFLGSSLGGFIVEAWGYRAMFASYIVFALIGLGVYFAFRKKLRD
jgi:MFS transporter, PPP family, 3-phenylpropionic acid transporter